jgi:hypothetical protein
LVIKTLDSELDPDPQLGKMLDPDPHSINRAPVHTDPDPDPQHWCKEYMLNSVPASLYTEHLYGADSITDPYPVLLDPELDLGGPKTYGS